MARLDQNQLRLEFLRVRASIERAELQAAVLELKRETQTLRRVLGVVSSVAQSGEGRHEGFAVVRTVIALLRERPWLVSALAAIVTRRGARRWLVLGAVAVVGAWLARRVVARAKAQPGGQNPTADGTGTREQCPVRAPVNEARSPLDATSPG